jgi:hypothetical protein
LELNTPEKVESQTIMQPNNRDNPISYTRECLLSNAAHDTADVSFTDSALSDATQLANQLLGSSRVMQSKDVAKAISNPRPDPRKWNDVTADVADFPSTDLFHNCTDSHAISLGTFLTKNPQLNLLDMRPPPNIPVTQSADMNHKSRGLAHLKIGIHAQEDSIPSWQYGLLDSGCSDNLISLSALKTLSDFENIQITTSQAKTIRTANNDQSQEIHGRITLNCSFLSEDGKRILFKLPFYVVSGLVYQIFLGQTFLTSPMKVLETNDALFFNINFSTKPNTRENMLEVRKVYKLRRPATSTKKVLIPAQTAMRVQTNFVNTKPVSEDSFYYFTSRPQFSRNYPKLHIPSQTCIPRKDSPLDIIIVNTSDTQIHLKSFTKLGFVQTELKNNAIIQPIHDFLRESPDILPHSETINLNYAARNTDTIAVPLEEDEDQPVPACNAAYTSSIYEHTLTPEEKEERNKQYKLEGYFQKSVSEVLSDSNNIPSFEYSGENQFVPKSDEELLSECDISHLPSDHRKLTRDMLIRNIDAFQRHPLDIGNCKDIVAFAPLTEPDPPMLYAKYVPIPLKYKEPAQKLIDEYCKAGVLAQTTETCRFTSNIFIIPKKDHTFRLIFDGRILSKYCQALPLALGNFDEIFAELADKEFVSKLDVSKAYDQISVTPETSRMLSFFGPDAKRYIYLRAGQGLKFSSFFLNQAMDTILFGMDDVKSYCDDVFCSSVNNFEDHLKLLEQVIQRFKAYHVKLKLQNLKLPHSNSNFWD